MKVGEVIVENDQRYVMAGYSKMHIENGLYALNIQLESIKQGSYDVRNILMLAQLYAIFRKEYWNMLLEKVLTDSMNFVNLDFSKVEIRGNILGLNSPVEKIDFSIPKLLLLLTPEQRDMYSGRLLELLTESEAKNLIKNNVLMKKWESLKKEKKDYLDYYNKIVFQNYIVPCKKEHAHLYLKNGKWCADCLGKSYTRVSDALIDLSTKYYNENYPLDFKRIIDTKVDENYYRIRSEYFL